MVALVDQAVGNSALADEILRRYGFAVPTAAALDAIANCSPHGVIEIGAGTGYWAAHLAQLGVDIAAFDRHPPPSRDNQWFAGTEPWYPVLRGDERVAEHCPERTLLLIWPTRNETWATTALERYRAAGGRCVAYVGQEPGGRTGDDSFHARLGEIAMCLACRYDVADVVCTCVIEPLWTRVTELALPAWQAHPVALRIYQPNDARRPRSRWRR